LNYTGFGGDGLQVRDILHVADLYELIRVQIENLAGHDGAVYNVGGGVDRSISLAELTEMCRERAGRRIEVGRASETNAADVPFYVTDNSQVSAASGWRPQRGLDRLLDEVFSWLQEDRLLLEPILTPGPPAPTGAPHSLSTS
jgi:CDP-paratose 2-epimerase